MKVICFYWQGDRWQSSEFKNQEGHVNLQKAHIDRSGNVTKELASKYVNNLYAGVKRFADREFDFICYTNEQLTVDNGVEVRELPLYTRSGVLPRLYMFSEDAGLYGHQVLCLDLDVIVVGSLKPLMDYEGEFCARAKFKRGEEYKLDGDIMSFKACAELSEKAWNPFIDDIAGTEQRTKGRERYYMRQIFTNDADKWDQIAPGAVLSYKRHITQNGKIPKSASIVSCHGFPRPHQLKNVELLNKWNND